VEEKLEGKQSHPLPENRLLPNQEVQQEAYLKVGM
jgi:hypothetical protein